MVLVLLLGLCRVEHKPGGPPGGVCARQESTNSLMIDPGPDGLPNWPGFSTRFGRAAQQNTAGWTREFLKTAAVVVIVAPETTTGELRGGLMVTHAARAHPCPVSH